MTKHPFLIRIPFQTLKQSLALVEDSYQEALAEAVGKGWLSPSQAAGIIDRANDRMVQGATALTNID